MTSPPPFTSFEEMIDVFDDRPMPGAPFAEAVTRFFRRYAVLTGRASRSEYWWVILFHGLVYLMWAALLVAAWTVGRRVEADISGAADGSTGSVALVVVLAGFGTYWLATLVPTIALRTRRLHDAGFSGWFQLLSLVPYVEIAVIVLTLLPSNPSGRRYDRPFPDDWDEPQAA